MKKLLWIFLFSICFHQGRATSYYVANSGNDKNDGKSKATAWKSLTKLAEASSLFKSGDSILLARGSVFTGQINISAPGLYLGAYGSGAKPVISGSIEIREWHLYKKNLWRAKCLSCPNPGNLFINGYFQPVGRYPNRGYLKLSAVAHSGKTLVDSDLTFNDGYWDGAEVVVRGNRWTIDNLLVKEYNYKTFITSDAPSYPLQPGFGYFIQKHISTLDQPGEWFYHAETKQIYLFLKPGVNPINQKIRVSILDFGLSITNTQNVIIENIIFDSQRLVGIIAKNSHNINLQYVEILNSGKNGLEVINCKNPCIENSLITNSNNNGVEWENNAGGIFLYNVIRRTGIYPGRGISGDGTYIALRITADKFPMESNTFQYNTIDSTGYIGIDFRTGNTIIKDNHISNFCLIKDDGGGIYTWGNTFGYNTIESNVISNGVGAGTGTINPTQLFASGIYIDDRSSGVLIKNNEVSNCATAGIFLHNAKGISVLGNRLFKNGNSLSNKEKGQLYIKLDTLGQFAGNYDLQLDVRMNIMIAVSDASYCTYLAANKKKYLRNLGKFSQNEFRAGRVQQALAELYEEGFCSAPLEFSLMDWQRESGYEKGSIFKELFSDGSFEITSENLIANGNMSASTKGWMVWPEKLVIIREKRGEVDGHALKVDFPVGSSEALLYHEGFALTKGALYRLSFSAGSLKEGKLEFVPLMANSPWQALGEYTCFSIGPMSKTFTYYFRPNQDNQRARINFKGQATFWIDNVSLYEITGTSIETDSH